MKENCLIIPKEMKTKMKHFACLLLLVAAFTSCGKSTDEPTPDKPTPDGATLSVSPKTAIVFSAKATERFDVEVNTNQTAWDAVSNQSWCMVSKSTSTFTVTASDNSATAERKATITVSAGKAKQVTIEVTQSGQPPVVGAAVGSFYYSDGTFSATLNSAKTCLGIVVRAKKAKEHGLIMSHDERDAGGWWVPTTPSSLPPNTQATDRDNGAINLTLIKKWNSWETRFPPFKWSVDKGEGWYLPAINELVDLYNMVMVTDKTINTKLASIPNGKAMEKANYWSSTESSSSNAYAISTVGIVSRTKSILSSMNVASRAVKAF